MDLTPLLGPTPNLEGIARALDLVGHETRIRSVTELGRRELAALYDASAANGPLGLDDLVPASLMPGTEVVYDGKNSRALLPRFVRRVRQPRGSEHLTGYDQLSLTRHIAWLGPDYFEVQSEGDHIVFDFARAPTTTSSPISPKRALARRIHGGTCEWVRRVSRDVQIGRVLRGRVPVDIWFVLVRRVAK